MSPLNRPSLPTKKCQNDNQNNSYRSTVVSIVVWLAAEVEAGEAIDDAPQKNDRTYVLMHFAKHGSLSVIPEAKVMVETEGPLHEDQGQDY
jgi:hypothetical protein